ncbi:MAG: hypothetical protein CMJ19_03955 [Phycisphaeraceae bacterium]|nr:hypothetical protein [Phycisphaeraceae bacterium]
MGELLFGLFFVLLIIMLLGHGMWVVVAWVFRLGKPHKDATFEPTVANDRTAAARYAKRLMDQGLIDKQMHLQLLNAIADDTSSEHRNAPPSSATQSSTTHKGNIRPWTEKILNEATPPSHATPSTEHVDQTERHNETQTTTETIESKSVTGDDLLEVLVDESSEENQPAPPPSSSIEQSPTQEPTEDLLATMAQKQEKRHHIASDQANPPTSPNDATPTFPDSPQRPTTVQPTPPAKPSRPLGEVLATFMAEKNIRWGELIGGMLIICCSAALVISLWSQIQAIPVLKFMIFTTVNAALFGAGLFVHHRWKVPTTGRAILSIATLLVPLNLLAFAAFSFNQQGVGPWTLITQALSVGIFAWLTFLAARVIMPISPKIQTAGFVAIATMSLLLQFLLLHEYANLMLICILIIGLYLIVTLLASWKMVKQFKLQSHKAERTYSDDAKSKHLLFMLFTQTFACIAPLGLTIHLTGAYLQAIEHIAPLLSVFTLPGLVISYILWQGPLQLSAKQRTINTSIFLACSTVMLLATGLAWPIPMMLLPTLLVNMVVMMVLRRVSVRFNVTNSWPNHLAMGWLTLAWLLLVHLLTGNIAWEMDNAHVLVQKLMSVLTGKALLAPILICIGLAQWHLHQRRINHFRGDWLIAGLFGLLSIMLITGRGFGSEGDPEHITWYYALYSVITLWAAWQLRLPAMTLCSVGLMQAALYQQLVYTQPLQGFSRVTSLLIGASVCIAGVMLTCLPMKRRLGAKLDKHFRMPWAFCAMGLSAIGGGLLFMQLTPEILGAFNLRLFWIAGLWMVLGLCLTSLGMFSVSQVIGLIALLCSTHHYLLNSQANTFAYEQLIHAPTYWQIQSLIVGGVCFAWLLIRLFIAKRKQAKDGQSTRFSRINHHLDRVINAPFPLLDDVLAWLTLAGSVTFGIWSVGVHVLNELGAAHYPPNSEAYPYTSALDTAGMLSWLVLGITVMIFVVRYFHRHRISSSVALSLCWLTATALAAAQFVTSYHVINVWRWLLAGSCLAAVTTLIIITKRLKNKSNKSIEYLQSDRNIGWCYALTALPALALTLGCMLALVQFPQTTDSLFTNILADAAYPFLMLHGMMYGPVILILGSFIMMGLAKQQRMYALLAATLTSISVLAIEACIFAFSDINNWISGIAFLVQINAVVSAVLALTWELLAKLLKKPTIRHQYPQWPLLLGRISLCIGMFLGGLAIFIAPVDGVDLLPTFGNLWAVGSLILVEWVLTQIRSRKQGHHMPIGFWCLMSVIMLSLLLTPWDTGNWLSYHTLSVGWVIAGWMMLFVMGHQGKEGSDKAWLQTYQTIATFNDNRQAAIEHDLHCQQCQYNLRGLMGHDNCPECGETIDSTIDQVSSMIDLASAEKRHKARWMTLSSIIACICLGMIFALRGGWYDPQRPWWSMGICLGITALSMALGAWAPRRSFAYLGGLAACIGVSIGFDQLATNLSAFPDVSYIINLVHVNLSALLVCAMAWLWIDRKYLRDRLSETTERGLPVFHHMVLITSTLFLAITSGQLLVNMIATQHGEVTNPITHIGITSWLAIGLTGLLATACVGETFRKLVPCYLYALGLMAMIHVLSAITIPVQSIELILALIISVYVLLTNGVLYIAFKKQRLQTLLAENVVIPYANTVFSILAIFCGIGISLVHPNLTARGIGCALPVINALAMMMLQKQDRWQSLRAYSLGLLCLFPLQVSWVWIAPDSDAVWPMRVVGYIQSYTLLTLLMSWFVSRLPRGNATDQALDSHDPNAWATLCKQAYTLLTALGAVALLYVSGNELATLLGTRHLPISSMLTYSMIICDSVLVVAFVFFAIKDRYDPLSLQYSYKQVYVYAAQVLGGMLALHLKLTMPWLFKGLVAAYWPLVVLGIALAGIAIGHQCLRRNLAVVGKPLMNTGTWLPLVACIEIFLGNSVIDYSLILLAVGGVYLVLAVMKRSFVLGIIATLALNGSLWHLLHRVPGLGINQHPQLWIIPLALTILASGYLNRKQLSDDQSRFIHYGCLLAIYLSSTLDVFLIGVVQAPWLPLVLAGLSIIGIFIGLAKRIRSYLFLGTGFLCLSLLTMIWHAATNLGWTWIWYVAGIALGIAIITVFALFEKKKNEMNKVIEGVKDWES